MKLKKLGSIQEWMEIGPIQNDDKKSSNTIMSILKKHVI